ncbi:phage tail assembly chaperone G [Aneurinibacillus sp. REN35]|uniref:phage tail assembly chaperone G n=1 Tax=Aneurinibacillus sp. REN35 TaxID=3237286 RepID=UPI003528E8F4
MEIALFINGEEKRFGTGFISARMFRRAIEMQKKMTGGVTSGEDLDEVVDYVVDMFGGKFTREQLYDGMEAEKFIPTIISCINQVVGKINTVTGGANADPNQVAKG